MVICAFAPGRPLLPGAEARPGRDGEGAGLESHRLALTRAQATASTTAKKAAAGS